MELLRKGDGSLTRFRALAAQCSATEHGWWTRPLTSSIPAVALGADPGLTQRQNERAIMRVGWRPSRHRTAHPACPTYPVIWGRSGSTVRAEFLERLVLGRWLSRDRRFPPLAALDRTLVIQSASG